MLTEPTNMNKKKELRRVGEDISLKSCGNDFVGGLSVSTLCQCHCILEEDI